MKTIIEPFRMKVVEPIRMTTREERRRYIEEAGFNIFKLKAEHVLIDLLTDSGTGAMSTAQWAGIIQGDESYAGAQSFFHFEKAVRKIFGHKYVIPTHQGRASERLLSGAVIKKDSVVPGNTHFDTTRANIEAHGALGIDLPIPEAHDTEIYHPFKGNIDLEALEKTFQEYGPERIPFVLMTVTSNSCGGQPVSMENLRKTKEICDKYGVPMLIDAARFAENAYFIKLREKGYEDKTPLEIAQEMFSLSDGAMMSMKKDAFGNMGGLISLNDEKWVEAIRTQLILTEGFPTYGGLAGRDLEALAIGLEEIVQEDYLRYRIRSTAYVGEHLQKAGVPLLKPFGGHAIYLNAREFCPHLSKEELPGWALSVALYEHAGIRSCEIGNVMFGRKLSTGEWLWPALDLVRLAIPRRVYTQSHMEYVIEAIIEVFQQRDKIRGLRFDHRPDVLPHFTATFKEI